MSASYPPRILKPSIAVQTNNSTQLNSSTSNWASLSDSNEFTTSPSTHSPVFHPLSDSISSSNNNHDDKNNKNNKNNNNLNLNLNPTSASTSTTSLASSTSPSSQAIFTQLQKIKTLQKEIAESHSILEGIGETSKQQSWYKDENNSGATTGDQGGRKSEKEGMKLSYEEMSKEFTERQENVQNIMIKVSFLSYLFSRSSRFKYWEQTVPLETVTYY